MNLKATSTLANSADQRKQIFQSKTVDSEDREKSTLQEILILINLFIFTLDCLLFNPTDQVPISLWSVSAVVGLLLFEINSGSCT